MSLLRVGRLMTAWQGTPLGPGGPHGRGAETDLQRSIDPTSLHCFASPGWSPGLCCERCCRSDRNNSPRGQGGEGHRGDPRPAESLLCGTCGHSPTQRAMLLLCLASLRGMGCTSGPIARCARLSSRRAHPGPPVGPEPSGTEERLWGQPHSGDNPRGFASHVVPHCLSSGRRKPFCRTGLRSPCIPASLSCGEA